MTPDERTLPARPTTGFAEAGLTGPRLDWWPLLRDQLALSPARTSRMLRMTTLVALVVVISMALRVPDAAVSAYMIFAVLRADVETTVRVGVALVITLTVAQTLALLFFMVALAEPAVRLPLMTALVFGGMYLTNRLRASPLGTLGLVLGFFASYALTSADQVPSPEALVHGLLWLWVVIAYPVGLIVLTELAFGTRPEEVYREGVAARLAAIADFLGAPAEDDAATRARLARLVRAGVADLAPYVKAGTSVAAVKATLLHQIELLGFLARALPAEVKLVPAAEPALRRARDACASARRALLGQKGDGEGAGARLEPCVLLAAEQRLTGALSPAALAVVLPMVGCIQNVILAVYRLLNPDPPGGEVAPRPARVRPALAAREESVRFALKVTLAAMTAYLIYTGLSWFSIHTALITCFFVAQDSVGATIHKLTLRIVGAVIGAALGIGAIVFALPRLQSVGGLAIVVAAVTLLAAWLATASQRISYAGWQVALAFYLTVLQGFSRTSKLYVGRDRVLGILLGNVLMTVVFTWLWPVRIKPALRQALSRSIDALAQMLRLRPDDRDRLDQLEAAVAADFALARRYAVPARFEGVDDSASIIALVEDLSIPLHAVAGDLVGDGLSAADPAARQALSAMHESLARWLSALAAAIAAPALIPSFSAPDAALATLQKTVGDTALSDEARARLRLHLDWFELLRMRIDKAPQGTPA